MKKIYVHPLPVRIWHWTNAALFLLLLVTGLQIRYLDLFSLMSFKTAVEVHNWVGFGLIGNYALWLGFYMVSDRRKVYIPDPDIKAFVMGIIRQVRFYTWGIFVGDPNPHRITEYRKFNMLQLSMYLTIMLVLMPLLFASGLMLWNVELFEPAIEAVGGIRIVAMAHTGLFVFFASFIISHVYLVTLGHTTMAHIKAMVDGYEEVDEEHSGS